MNKKVGNIATSLAGILLLVMGLIYFFKNSFMPYHSDAVVMPWEKIEPNMQFLLLGLMRAVAGGFFAAGVIILFLQRKFYVYKTTWIPTLIVISGLLISLPTLYATLTIKLNTPGNPPILLLVLGILFLIVGYFFNLKSLKN